MRYIVKNPNILGGTPVIVGTRIPVAKIISLLHDGFTVEAIHQQYPQVKTDILNKVISEVEKFFARPSTLKSVTQT